MQRKQKTFGKKIVIQIILLKSQFYDYNALQI